MSERTLRLPTEINISKKLESWGNAVGIRLMIPANTCTRYSKVQTDIWNHVMRHLRPKNEVSVLKKNILINDLKHLKDTQPEPIVVPSGVKTCKDLERCNLYSDLNKQLNDRARKYEDLKRSVENQLGKIKVLDENKEIIRDKIKEIKAKNMLMKLNLKRIDKLTNSNHDILEIVKAIKKICSIRTATEKKDQLDIAEILNDIEALYHSDELGEGKTNLSWEESSLWVKAADYMIYSPKELYAAVIDCLQKNNAKMRELLVSSAQNSNKASFPDKRMIEIHGLHIKLFVQIHELKKTINNLNNEINILKDDVCSKVLQKFSNRSTKDNNQYELMSIINRKCDEILKEESNKYLKTQLELLKTNSCLLESQKAALIDLKKKLDCCNTKIEEKAKTVSKYNAAVLNDNYQNISNLCELYFDEAVGKFNDIQLIVNRNAVAENNSTNESLNIFTTLEGCVKNEVDLSFKIPYQKLNRVNRPLRNVDISSQNVISGLPYNMLICKTWMKVLNDLSDEFQSSLPQSVLFNTDNLQVIKALEGECEDFEEKKERIDLVLNSAKEAIEAGMDYSLLLDENNCLMINEILTNEKTDTGETFGNIIKESLK